MPDEKSAQAGGQGEQGGAAAADKANAADQGAADNGQQDKGGEAAADADKGKGGEADADKFDDDGSEPVTRQRKTAKDYIIERKNRQIEKAKAKAGEGDGGGQGDNGEGDGGDADEDAEIDPEDAELISKVVDKKLEPLMKEQQAKADDAEVQAFLASNPQFKKYEAKARRYMAHPSRANLPVSSIFYEVAGPDLLKLGAKMASAADAEAKAKETAGGSGGRTMAGEKSVSEMTDQEFREYQDKVRRGAA